MPQVSSTPLEKEIKEKINSLFFLVLSQVKNQKSAKKFYNAIFTPTERVMFPKRFAAFYLLEKGLEQDKIASLLKISPSTVTRLNFWWKSLESGEQDLIKRLMLKKEVKSLLIDLVNTFKYGPLPPKYRNWSEWQKEKNKWIKEMENPLR